MISASPNTSDGNQPSPSRAKDSPQKDTVRKDKADNTNKNNQTNANDDVTFKKEVSEKEVEMLTASITPAKEHTITEKHKKIISNLLSKDKKRTAE